MKYLIENKHREVYQYSGWVTLGPLWTEKQLDTMTELLRASLARRLDCAENRIEHQPFAKTYLQSRDLWRESDELRRLIALKGAAEVQAELSDKRPLRLAFSQLLWSSPDEVDTAVDLPWITHSSSLQESCSIQGMAGAVLVPLTHPTLHAPIQKLLEAEEELIPPIQYPEQKGETVFVTPSLSWQLPPSEEPGLFCLIGFASAAARYYIEARDPFTHTLKSLGYSAGDRLTDALHPIVCR